MKKLQYLVIGSVLAATLLFAAAACKKEKPAPANQEPPLPVLSTLPMASVNDSTAIGGGSLSSAGNSDLIASGICWDTLPQPTLSSKVGGKNLAVGTFTAKLSGLKPGYRYYLRAFATNGNGTAYGNEQSFVAAPRWNKLDSSAIDNVLVNCLFASENKLFAGSNDGVLFSADTGSTFLKAGLEGQNIVFLAANGTALFAAGYQQVFRSTNNGLTWDNITSSIPASIFYTGDLIVSGDEVLVSTYDNVFVSADNGSTWTPLGTGLPKSRFYSHLSANNEFVFVTSADNNSLSGGLHRLPRGETGWENVSPPVLNDLRAFDIACSGNAVFFSTSNAGNVYVSYTNGGSWAVEATLPAGVLYFCDSNKLLLACDAGGRYFISESGGKRWVPISNKGINGTLVRSTAVTAEYMFSATLDKGVFKRRRWEFF